MAKGKKTGGRNFKKGDVTNPKGRPALPEIIREKSYQTKPQIIEAYFKLANMSLDSFKSYKPETAIEAGIQKCIGDFTRTGRTDQIRHIWAECHGKPRETVDLNQSGNINLKIEIIGVSPGEEKNPD